MPPPAAILGVFSSGGRHNPERLVQINLGPPAAAKFCAPQGQIRQNLERITDNGSARVFVYTALQMTDSGGIGDGGVVLCLDWLEDFLEAVSRIEIDIAASSGKAAYLSGGFGQLVRCYRMPRGFHRPDCAQNIGWHKLTDGLFANPLIEQGNEPLFFLILAAA